MWANVQSDGNPDGSLFVSFEAHPSVGTYTLKFDGGHDLTRCGVSAALEATLHGDATTLILNTSATSIAVFPTRADGTPLDSAFHLLVICP
jgi:hypothetical protein